MQKNRVSIVVAYIEWFTPFCKWPQREERFFFYRRNRGQGRERERQRVPSRSVEKEKKDEKRKVKRVRAILKE